MEQLQKLNFQNVSGNILSIDQGTTSTRICVLDNKLSILYIEQVEHEQIHQFPGWTEHDPMQIYFNVKLLIEKLYHKSKELLNSIKSIGITNQRETCLAWDKQTGEHLTNAIVWHDTRTISIVDDILNKNSNNKDCYRDTTGLPINTYFSAVKIKWMIENEESLKIKFSNKDFDNICFGTIDSWLVYKLTGNHYTDITNASRTMLMNLKTLEWDQHLLSEFNIPLVTLPKILNSSDDFGKVLEGHLKGVRITGVIGDQQSACMGHLLQKVEVKNTYGTGCFILMNTGDKIVHSQYGLLTTVLYKGNMEGDNKALYALEGAIETAGSALDWLKNNLKIFTDYNMISTLFNSVTDSGGVVFVPAFSGLFSPHWDNTARGLLIGLSHHTQQGHIIRATFEAISMRTYEVINSFEKESGIKVDCLKVDGGLTSSEDFLQTQSCVLGINVERQKEKEITIIGSAIVAGLEKGVGMWKDFDELRKLINVDKVYKPKLTREHFDKLHSRWNVAVEKSKNWI